jgi:Family of unknown function (DUF6516)
MTRSRIAHSDKAFSEVVVWAVQKPLRGSNHNLKYRLALVVGGVCVLRYDNESGKGDHRHIGSKESPYGFSSLDKLFADFQRDLRRVLNEDSDS